jgi:hypothetical protein
MLIGTTFCLKSQELFMACGSRGWFRGVARSPGAFQRRNPLSQEAPLALSPARAAKARSFRYPTCQLTRLLKRQGGADRSPGTIQNRNSVAVTEGHRGNPSVSGVFIPLWQRGIKGDFKIMLRKSPLAPLFQRGG